MDSCATFNWSSLSMYFTFLQSYFLFSIVPFFSTFFSNRSFIQYYSILFIRVLNHLRPPAARGLPQTSHATAIRHRNARIESSSRGKLSQGRSPRSGSLVLSVPRAGSRHRAQCTQHLGLVVAVGVTKRRTFRIPSYSFFYCSVIFWENCHIR